MSNFVPSLAISSAKSGETSSVAACTENISGGYEGTCNAFSNTASTLLPLEVFEVILHYLSSEQYYSPWYILQVQLNVSPG